VMAVILGVQSKNGLSPVSRRNKGHRVGYCVFARRSSEMSSSTEYATQSYKRQRSMQGSRAARGAPIMGKLLGPFSCACSMNGQYVVQTQTYSDMRTTMDVMVGETFGRLESVYGYHISHFVSTV
jgi:hypothetical protein